MDDSDIITLFWARNEEALTETAQKYGHTLSALAHRILGDPEDGRETVNDTYLRAWEAIPPARPEHLCAYLCRIVRRLSIDRLRRRDAQKRVGESYALTLEELGDCVSGREDPVTEAESRRLTAEIAAFLRTLPEEKRRIFADRYFSLVPIRELAEKNGCSEERIKSLLLRLRRALAVHLEKEGFDL